MAHFYDSLSVYPLEFVAYHAINVYYSRKGSLPGSTVAMGKEHAGCWMLDAACRYYSSLATSPTQPRAQATFIHLFMKGYE